MFESVTPQAIIDDVNALTDNDGYSLVTSAQLIGWLNCELTSLWLTMIRCSRDAFTKTAEGRIVTAPSISMTAAAPTGLAITDFLSIRGVDLKLGEGMYKKLRPFNFVTRDRTIMLSYRAIGEDLWILPQQQSTLYPIRVWYMYKAPTASASALSTAMSIPANADDYVKQGMCAKFRIRRDEDPSSHLQQQALALEQIKAWLMSSRGDQGTIADVSDDYWGDQW